MSLKRKRSVLSIKDKQSIIVRLEKGEKGTNLSVEYGVSNSEAVECFKRCLSWMERQNNVEAIQIMQLRRSWVLLFINIHIFDYPDYFVWSQRVRIIEVRLYIFVSLMIAGQRLSKNGKRRWLDFFRQFSKRPHWKTFHKLGSIIILESWNQKLFNCNSSLYSESVV